MFDPFDVRIVCVNPPPAVFFNDFGELEHDLNVLVA